MNDRFAVRDHELMHLARTAASLKLKGDVVTLGFSAIDFRRELSGWIALARRIRDELYAEAIDSSHGERMEEAKANDLKRADSTLVKTRAASVVGPVSETVERLNEARSEMDTLVSWCQSLQRSISSEEYGSIFESSNVVPEELYDAPVGSALRALQH
jgi:hypothetical protein